MKSELPQRKFDMIFIILRYYKISLLITNLLLAGAQLTHPERKQYLSAIFHHDGSAKYWLAMFIDISTVWIQLTTMVLEVGIFAFYLIFMSQALALLR